MSEENLNEEVKTEVENTVKPEEVKTANSDEIEEQLDKIEIPEATIMPNVQETQVNETPVIEEEIEEEVEADKKFKLPKFKLPKITLPKFNFKKKEAASPVNEEVTNVNPMPTQAAINPTRRVLRGDFVALVALILIIIISAVKVPSFIVDKRLVKLGYDEKAIEAIKDKKISKRITSNQYYSEYLASEVTKDSFRPEYLELYVYEDNLTDEDFLIYEKLQKMGYSEEDVIKIFKELDNQEISALLVFDKQDNLDPYIADCKKNRAMNKNGGLTLSGHYLKPYENVKPAPGIGTDAVLVNKKYDLGTYEPSDLKTLNTRYAIDGVMLSAHAHDAFIDMCNDMSAAGLGIYSIGGYRSYETQAEYYGYYDTKAEADIESIRPGFSETQTGLSVQVVDGTNEDLSKFATSKEYKWLEEHAHEYGFILRYPSNKQSITGHDGEAYRYRYVGKNLASSIKKSGLTLEEYYVLHLEDVKVDNTQKTK